MSRKKLTTIDDKLHWYKDAIIYELHIKAFRDSNGDGIGDFEGLLEKLDYLQSLGITAIWLLPFYPSPLQDDGYDIADYYSINPSYGNIEQFKKLLDEAHKRNLKVITELVINHTSNQHPWFQKARKAPKGSPARDYYVWTDDPNQYKDARIIFQDFEGSNWTWDPVAKQYYWHRFFHHQPDLNFDNPAVQEEVFNVLDYWCEMGVDGFRLDAVPYLFERDGTNCENLPETHAFLKKLRKHVDNKYPGTLLLAEANMWPEDSASYFGDGDECQMNYHFPVMPRMYMAIQMEDRYPVTDIFDQTPAIPDSCQWAIFLRNHDELTLEMVTDEERDYMYKVYVKDPKARINLGIRHRLAPLMGNDRRKIEMMNYLLFSLPGTPVLYYGDEIGMGDNFYLGDRDGVRTPMQWSGERNAGFSETNPQQLYLPLIYDPLYHFESVNVELQSKNRSSLLWYMKRLIATRKKYKAFSRGNMQFIEAENSKVLSFTRSYEDETILVIVNLSRFPQPAELDLSEFSGCRLVETFSKNKFPAIRGNAPYFFTLSGHECLWFEIQKVATTSTEPHELHTLELNERNGILSENTGEELATTIIPEYLMKMRWFGGKARNIHNISVSGAAEIGAGKTNAVILIVEVAYENGLPELYQLPVMIATGHAAASVCEHHPNAVLCNILMGEEKGVLFEAVFDEGFRKALFDSIVAGNRVSIGNADEIVFARSNRLHAGSEERGLRSKILGVEQSNTSIVYDNAYFLKLYRKVDRSINPDLELSRFLTDEAKFQHTPEYLGDIQWISGNDALVLGMLQKLVPYSTDGWSYILDRLSNFYEKIQLDKEVLRVALPENDDFFNPYPFDELAPDFKALLETTVTEKIALLGKRTGELHLAFASSDSPAFQPEPFSLHYQRSLFSSFQSLVRTTWQTLAKNIGNLPPALQEEAAEILAMRHVVLQKFKAIYAKKLDVVKTRMHGDYHLGQTLFTGNDILIIDFEGEPARSYSERRIKRSPLRDVAGMIRSFHYAAYAGLFLDTTITKNEQSELLHFAEQWYQYMSGFFMQAYLETVKGMPFVPTEKYDQELLLETYLLEKAIYELNYELNNRPNWIIIPLRGIKAIMQGHGNSVAK
jgi:maltose alpha-D-glucosyltransferase/alpha-amylase